MRSLALAAAFALICTPSAFAAPSSAGRLEFEVLRNGQPFGRHVISVAAQSGGYGVRSEIELRVGAGPLTLFRYEQNCTETWRADGLTGLDCSTLKEGRRTIVHAETVGETLRVRRARGERDLPRDIWPTSWWTKPPIGAEILLNTETGVNTPMRVTRIGEESIDVGGQRIRAERIRVQGTLTADLWYDERGRWVGCAFTARGQRVTYRLISPLAAAPA
jgi:hypothetical protein